MENFRNIQLMKQATQETWTSIDVCAFEGIGSDYNHLPERKKYSEGKTYDIEV